MISAAVKLEDEAIIAALSAIQAALPSQAVSAAAKFSDGNAWLFMVLSVLLLTAIVEPAASAVAATAAAAIAFTASGAAATAAAIMASRKEGFAFMAA